MNLADTLNFRANIEQDQTRFRELADQLSSLLRDNGYEIHGYTDPSIPHFTELSSTDRSFAMDEVARYLKICTEVVNSGAPLNSSPKFTWRAIRELGLMPPENLFSRIGPGDIVEIYNLSNIQRFRNFLFFKYSSYTVEDLYTRPWTDLFKRHDNAVTDAIISLIATLVSTRDKLLVETGIGSQIIEETLSSRRYVTELNVKHLGVLYNRKDEPSAFIVIEDAKRLNRS